MSAASFSPFQALRHRNFRLFFFGQGTSLAGTWMQSVAQGWLVLQLTNSPYYVGLVSALGSLPVLLVSLPAGVFADRTHKRRRRDHHAVPLDGAGVRHRGADLDRTASSCGTSRRPRCSSAW